MAEVPAVETANNGPISRARTSLAALETLERLRQAPHIPPSPDDLAALRGWSGWGPLAPALEYSRSGSWKEIGERIAYLLPQEHYDHGVQATYNAFYTPPEIASACWDVLAGLGFDGGRILEPGCGAGVFMASTPTGISATWTGVERDPTTAAIARRLHPNATIHAQRLEETPLPTHSADAVLGNVPFGDTKVYDPTTPRELTANLHNYFIYRSVQALRPGGIAVLITSRYTLDAAGDTAQNARLLISREAELLGAIRPPNDALTSGGTEPLVDILVLRRRRPDEPPRSEQDQWITTGSSVGGQQVNTYFLANPAMVLGELAEDRAPRYGRTVRVDARPDDPPLAIALATAGHTIASQAIEADRGWRVDTGASPITAETAPFELRADGKKEGSFHLIDGAVHEVVEAQLVPVARPGKELPKLIALRDAVVDLLNGEADHSRPDAELEPLRVQANQLYDTYVKAHGYLNRYKLVEGKPDEEGIVQSSRRRPSMGGFRRDPDFVTVLALEDFDDDTQTAIKAALLTRRVNRPRERATHAETPAEAIALCRDELGALDLGRVAELLGVEQGEAERQIADVAFLDPETNQWVPSDEYLTGNVRQKLDYAKTAVALRAEDFQRNVPALEAVIPADLQPEQILANLGAPWVPASDVQEFAQELLGFRTHVWNEPRTSTWSVRTSQRAEESAVATSDWGTGRLNAYKLLDYGLNGKAPTVYDVIDDKRVRNQDETLAANDRLDAIAARFATWVWEDPDRADRLATAYNRTFNAIVPRRFDGTHLTFPGLDSGFEPYTHQRDMVARMIAGSDALCPYPVGTGKTATMFMSAIKLKALGLASKPLIIVVPSTLEQIARDGKRLFPNARILMAGKEDLADARARKLFAARSAMEDWDAVVMSHPSFTSLPVHPTVQAGYATNLAAEYRSALISAQAESAEPRKIKQIAKMVDNLEVEAKRLLKHATDDGVFFEHLGVDYLLVDEMHYFKNLGVPVHTDGFSVNGSKRAQDLDMKLGWLRSRHPSLAVVTGFTGTPVSNTLLEAFILQHYLQPARLAELGLQSADAWAANFVRFATAVEVTADGGFKLNRRPAEIINIPDLMNTFGEFAELRPPESFPVKRPEVSRHNVAIEASDTVLDYVRSLAERADDIHAGGVPSSVDNILKICTDGRKVALHESLVGLEPEGPGKIGALVGNVARIYHETKDLELPRDDSGVRGRLQLIFCDLGTPNKYKGNQVYGLIRQDLIASGVPAERIRFIHEATTDARRLVLFDQCNRGEVAVLLGSTDKLGVGVNVQRRAVALHHVDAPWRPDQVEQRDGRVWRPKNLNTAVEIYRYVTEGSFDAFMWQALERKEKSLRPILAGQATARSVEDIGDIALDYGQIKAISTGNPLLTELNEVAFEVKRLTSLTTNHQRTQRRLRSDIQTLTMQAAAATNTVDALDGVAETATQNLDDTRWRDTRGNPVLKDDEIAPLGALAESTIAKGYCDGAMQWRGLTIDFTATKQWRDTELAARVTAADRHRITVPLNVAWAAKGQHWRIRDAIATAVDEAHLTAAATRENIDVLKQRVTENEAALGQPFADADALDEARTRRAVLETAIREQAQKDEEARRNRTSRVAANTSSASQEDEVIALLTRLHTAFTTVAEQVTRKLEDPQEGPDIRTTRDQAPTDLEATATSPDVHKATLPNEPEVIPERPEDLSAVVEDVGRERDAELAIVDVSAQPAHPTSAAEPETAPAQASDVVPVAPVKPDEEAKPDDDGVQTPAIPGAPKTTSERSEEPTNQLDATAVTVNQEQESEPETVSDVPTELPQPETSPQVEVSPAQTASQPSPEPAEPVDLDAPVDSPDDNAAPGATTVVTATAPELTRRSQARRRDRAPKDVGQGPQSAAHSDAVEPQRRASTRHAPATPVIPSDDQRQAAPRPGRADTGTTPRDPKQQQSPATADTSLSSTRPTTENHTQSRPAAQPAPPSSPPQRSPQFEHAIDLALQGFAVFPLRPGTKEPLVKDWERQATTDPQLITRWWNSTPNANIAIACGPSNLFVIDLDAAKRPGDSRHGQRTLIALANGREIPRTFTVASARGGRHLYFQQPEGAALRNTAGSERAGLGPLIDTRGHGGYVVAPGSVFEGGSYRIERDASVAPLPSWIVSELETRKSPAASTPAPSPSREPVTGRRRSAYGEAALRRSADTVSSAPEGTRNDTLNREAFRLGRLVGGGVLDQNDAATALRCAARKAGLPPSEAESTIASGLTAGLSRPRSISDRAPDPQTKNPNKEIAMSTTTTQAPHTTDQTVAAPPNAADLYPQLSAPGSHAFQDALRTLWRLGPTAVGLPETDAEPVRAAWQAAGQQMATAIHEHESPEAPDGRTETAPAEAATTSAAVPPTVSPETSAQEDPMAGPETDFDFKDIWTDVRTSIERARQVLPDWSELSTTDDLKPAIDEVLRYLAQTPILRSTAGRNDDTAASENPATAATESANSAAAADQYTTAEESYAVELAKDPADDLDEHLAAVDAAYADAQSAGIPANQPEWAGITAIHNSIHNLWDTIKAAAGTYWAELSADVRVRGLLTALATRAARAIASLANAAAAHLEQHDVRRQLSAEAKGPGLREAYINARNQVRAHAAAHEWQRIAALWGTVNTLARQSGDPGIRAVVARSSDAISDYADALRRKTTQYGHAGATDALATLASAAERHAATLRATDVDQANTEQHRAPAAVDRTHSVGSASPAQADTKAQLLQARARQVAQHAQARLGQSPQRVTAGQRRAHSVGDTQDQSSPLRPMQPCSQRESANIQIQ